MSRPCVRPLSDRELIEWWIGESGVPDRRLTEEHLLGCDSCSQRARVLQALAEGVAGLVRTGRVQGLVTEKVIDRLRLEGRRIREYRVSAGGSVHCHVAPDDDFLISRLEAEIGSATRVDVGIRIDDGPEIRIADLPCEPGSGQVILTFPVDEIGALPAHVEHVRLLAVEAAGERLIGEYTFHHSPWPGRSGPPPS